MPDATHQSDFIVQIQNYDNFYWPHGTRKSIYGALCTRFLPVLQNMNGGFSASLLEAKPSQSSSYSVVSFIFMGNVKILLVRRDVISWVTGLLHNNARQFITLIKVDSWERETPEIEKHQTPMNNDDSALPYTPDDITE